MSGYGVQSANHASPRPRMHHKITVLGDGGVGKTALTVQFTMSSFVETYDPTIEDCYRKQWSVDGQPCMLEVLDTAGQEEYTALRDQWIRDGEGFLIVYSIASYDTFSRVESIHRRIIRVKEDSSTMYGAPYASPAQRSPYASPTSPSSRPQNIPIVIVGNKRDLTRGREVSPEDGARLAQRLGCEFFETSAKTGYNVENAFRSIVRGIKASKGGGGQPDGRTQESGGGGVMAGTKKSKRSRRKCVIL